MATILSAISGAWAVVSNLVALVTKRFTANNSEAMQKRARAANIQKLKDESAKAVAKGDIEQLQKDIGD
jgi:hypothetical protein